MQNGCRTCFHVYAQWNLHLDCYLVCKMLLSYVKGALKPVFSKLSNAGNLYSVYSNVCKCLLSLTDSRPCQFRGILKKKKNELSSIGWGVMSSIGEQKHSSPKSQNCVTPKQEASVFGISGSDRLLGKLKIGNNKFSLLLFRIQTLYDQFSFKATFLVLFMGFA